MYVLVHATSLCWKLGVVSGVLEPHVCSRASVSTALPPWHCRTWERLLCWVRLCLCRPPPMLGSSSERGPDAPAQASYVDPHI